MAAILFTTGSTGPAKGVVYTHGNFDAQIKQIQDHFQIGPDEIDLPTFPLFALFDPALGMTAVIPDMDFTRPAQVDGRKIVEAIEKANAELNPVQVGVGRMLEGRFVFNRRAVKRDGKVMMPGPAWIGPLGNTDILYIEGPIDPELGVLCLRGADLRFVSILVSYTCHPVHVYPKPIVSADWPGAACAELEQWSGNGCVPMVLNGCCGNINPWITFDPNYVNDHRPMGKALASGAQRGAGDRSLHRPGGR